MFPVADRSGKKPVFTEYFFSITDGKMSRYATKEKQLKLRLIEDGQTHFFEGAEADLLQWKLVIDEVSLKWGAVQKTKLEHEVAYLRKQLGLLWEMCENGEVPPKVQKRMSEITMDMQVKDDLLADVTAMQEELSMIVIKSRPAMSRRGEFLSGVEESSGKNDEIGEGQNEYNQENTENDDLQSDEQSDDEEDQDNSDVPSQLGDLKDSVDSQQNKVYQETMETPTKASSPVEEEDDDLPHRGHQRQAANDVNSHINIEQLPSEEPEQMVASEPSEILKQSATASSALILETAPEHGTSTDSKLRGVLPPYILKNDPNRPSSMTCITQDQPSFASAGARLKTSSVAFLQINGTETEIDSSSNTGLDNLGPQPGTKD
eukprot:jgi/Hompol1/1681/HPOL_005683-RA